jgi:hypothetical protein
MEIGHGFPINEMTLIGKNEVNMRGEYEMNFGNEMT